jgi:ADP-dependent NAD(P)H-hydrate dehydratase / NAD(P)H-hydrate epimerase
MMKLLTASQIRETDQYTIENEPIASIDLMERAARQCSHWLKSYLPKNQKIMVFTGPGNNGGDGLAIARQLAENGYNIVLCQVKFTDKLSAGSQINLKRLKDQGKVKMLEIFSEIDIPGIDANMVVIDAIFGSGLSRPSEGLALQAIQKINRSGAKVIAIDVPSGLYSENNKENPPEGIIRAARTLTFQLPKLSFLLAKNNAFTGKWHVLDIGLDPGFMQSCESNFFWADKKSVQALLKPRQAFSHKGKFGHALHISGSYGKMGAAIMGAHACLRSGCGLVTVHAPKSGVGVVQVALPEAMVSFDSSEYIFSTPPEMGPYSAIGIGPGLGTADETAQALHMVLRNSKAPLVIDADGLNILAQNPEWMNLLEPNKTVLTPHPKEFERLFGKMPPDMEMFDYLCHISNKFKAYIVYKEAYTKIACPDGKIIVNSTGNPGMATAGSGDVLTGIILSFVAQGMAIEAACVLAVFVHGLAGDLYVPDFSETSLTAGDLIEYLGKTFKKLMEDDKN